jgi:hypothetical protein
MVFIDPLLRSGYRLNHTGMIAIHSVGGLDNIIDNHQQGLLQQGSQTSQHFLVEKRRCALLEVDRPEATGSIDIICAALGTRLYKCSAVAWILLVVFSRQTIASRRWPGCASSLNRDVGRPSIDHMHCRLVDPSSPRLQSILDGIDRQ